MNGTTYLAVNDFRNVYQPTSYWEAYRPYQSKTYRGWIMEPKPYHSVRELEMDRISKDKHLEQFFGETIFLSVHF